MPAFSSRVATILAMIGVAVGLGNVWRFPYMMGQYGGSAFLLVYMLCTLVFALPAMMAEWALGRGTREGPLGAFRQTLGVAPGTIVGLLLLVTVLVADSYYLVVIANVFYAMLFSAVHGFGEARLAEYQSGLGNGVLQYGLALFVLLSCLLVLWKGLRAGIERVSKLFVPAFGIIVLILIANALTMEGALGKLAVFLRPDFSVLQAEHIFAALGQAFFSLSLGGTFLVVYGSYLREEESIPRTACWVAMGDAGAALLASLFIVPTILVFNLDMTAGPQLVFSTLPPLFGQMIWGRLFGTLFLAALTMVAFLSALAALEVIVATLSRYVWTRKQWIVMIGGLEVLLIAPSAADPGIIGILDLIFGSGMQVLGSTFAVIAFAWGLRRSALALQLQAPGLLSPLLLGWLRWVVPAGLIAGLAYYVIEMWRSGV